MGRRLTRVPIKLLSESEPEESAMRANDRTPRREFVAQQLDREEVPPGMPRWR